MRLSLKSFHTIGDFVVYLFALVLNHILPQWLSWYRETQALAWSTFSQMRTSVYLTLLLLHKVLQKLVVNQVTAILITPC